MPFAGSGYMLACLAWLVGPRGWVLGVEKHERLADMARFNTGTGGGGWVIQYRYGGGRGWVIQYRYRGERLGDSIQVGGGEAG